MNKEPDRNQRKALGKGLSALLPSRSSASEPAIASSAAAPAAQVLPGEFEEFQSIPLTHIEPGNQQPRDTFDDQKLQELAESIKVHGVIQPITIRKTGSQQYRIVAGERRWRAAKLAGLQEIPALVRKVEEDSLLEVALIENIQREDLNPIEVAQAFSKLHDEYGLSHEQIAARTGKERSTVTNFLRLLKLIPPVRRQLATGKITMGHARALLNLNSTHQALLCGRIVDEQLSVRETEARVRHYMERERLNENPSPQPASAATPAKVPAEDPNVRAALEEMAMALGTKVKLIPRSDKSGRLEIEYYSQEDLDRIYSVIVG